MTAHILYNAGVWSSPALAGPLPPRGALATPDAPIAALADTSAAPRLPLVTLPARRRPAKRIRSFGDLGSVDNLPSLCAATVAAGGLARAGSAMSLDALAGASDDDDAAVVPGGDDGDASPPATTDYSSADMADGGGWSESSDDDRAPVAPPTHPPRTLTGRPPRPPRARAPGPRAPPPSARPASLMDAVILAEWAARAADGLFRYDVGGLPTRVLGGSHGFVAQCNTGRATKKRPTEFARDAVVQAYDPAKFNFTKAAQKEVLFALAADGPPGTRAAWTPCAPAPVDPSLLLINVSPIEYGHVLLIPRVLAGLPQLVDVSSLALALRFASECDNPYLRLCYNSLGAYGTVNHLHFQAYFMATPFPVEVAACAPLRDTAAARRVPPTVHCCTLAGYPARGLVFEAAAGDLDALATVAGAACERLAGAGVPHNLFIADCGQRAFLFPNVFGAAKAAGTVPDDLLDTGVDPACFELAGHMVFKRDCDFELPAAGALALVDRLLALASPPQAEFEAIVQLALGVKEEGGAR